MAFGDQALFDEALFDEVLFGGKPIADAGVRILGASRMQFGAARNANTGTRIQGAGVYRFGGALLELPAGTTLRLAPWLRDGG